MKKAKNRLWVTDTPKRKKQYIREVILNRRPHATTAVWTTAPKHGDRIGKDMQGSILQDRQGSILLNNKNSILPQWVIALTWDIYVTRANRSTECSRNNGGDGEIMIKASTSSSFVVWHVRSTNCHAVAATNHDLKRQE